MTARRPVSTPAATPVGRPADKPVEMPVVWSGRHRGHAPDGGYWLGVHLPGDEEPERGDVLIRDLGAGDVREPTDHGIEPVLAVHDAGMLDHLATAHAAWVAAGHPVDPGQPNVVPYIVPRGRVVRPASTVRAQAGWYASDTMTLIGAGTYDAARAAVDGALTAADLVLAGGHRAAYAAVRPPGHHAGPAYFGGSCYLNNAAVAAAHLVDRGVGRVAVIDIDAHHGNGTQDIFYERDDVHYVSVHVDPAAGWYPHYCGHADERGAGDGEGANHNLPVPPGAGSERWLAALGDGLARLPADAAVAVVSLGVDAAAGDPESPLEVDAAGFAEAGRMIAALGIPAVFVQEGGYDLATLGQLVRAVLRGFEQAGGPTL